MPRLLLVSPVLLPFVVMPPRGHSISILLVAAGACYAPPDRPARTAGGPPERSEVVFQAVDAGTGSTLLDTTMTVRYLVRSPITLDATSVEQVASGAPYTIAEDIAEDELVVEVRVEAETYHRFDTVFSVARGATAGPMTMRLARRLDRVAGADEPEETPDPTPATPAGETTPSATALARAALQEGDRAFQRGDWVTAIEAYERMPAPVNGGSEYGQQYQRSLLRRGVAHINRGEFGSALEILEDAARFESPGFNTYLRLAQAQCAVGRTEEGRGTLAELGRGVSRLPVSTRPLVTAMVQYQRGLCSHGEFDRAQTTRDRVRTGAAAIRQLEAFVSSAEQINPSPSELQVAIADAQTRVQRIRQQIRG